jgi:hypothetical protein
MEDLDGTLQHCTDVLIEWDTPLDVGQKFLCLEPPLDSIDVRLEGLLPLLQAQPEVLNVGLERLII